MVQLNNIMVQMDVTGIYKTLIPNIPECTFSLATHWTFLNELYVLTNLEKLEWFLKL